MQAASQDPISGLILYQAGFPTSGISAGSRIKAYGSVAEMEADGWVAGSATTGVGHYYATQFFRLQPGGTLYIGIYAVPGGDHDFAEIVTVARFADRTIRQFGIFTTKAYATGMVAAAQTQLNTLAGEYADAVCVIGADITGTADATQLANIATGTNGNVTVCIAQSGNGVGKQLATDLTKSVPAIGAALGAMALANVNESIGWAEKFNLASGTDMDTLELANGQKVANLSNSTLGGLSDKGYLLARKIVGFAGSFFADTRTAAAPTSDLSTIENVRTIQKAKRGIYAALAPTLNSPLVVEQDGKLSLDTAGDFERRAINVLTQMQADREISTFGVRVPRQQNVLATSKLVMNVTLVPVGVARQIEVNLGFAARIA